MPEIAETDAPHVTQVAELLEEVYRTPAAPGQRKEENPLGEVLESGVDAVIESDNAGGVLDFIVSGVGQVTSGVADVAMGAVEVAGDIVGGGAGAVGEVIGAALN